MRGNCLLRTLAEGKMERKTENDATRRDTASGSARVQRANIYLHPGLEFY